MISRHNAPGPKSGPEPGPEPHPGQESVWDFPRPPRVELLARRVRVLFDDTLVADSLAAYRVLETSHPPTIYVPPQDVRLDLLRPGEGRSYCEFKGLARYWTLVAGGQERKRVAWSYADPTPGYEVLRDHLSFYPSRVDACFIGEEQVTAQEGDFYGGWITAGLVGPFKGGPGTTGW